MKKKNTHRKLGCAIAGLKLDVLKDALSNRWIRPVRPAIVSGGKVCEPVWRVGRDQKRERA